MPTSWGNGAPMVVPNLAFVNCTLLAVIVPMFWSWYVALTVANLFAVEVSQSS
jgi:hypothetical protein